MKETLIRSLTGIAFVAIIIASLSVHSLSYLVLFSLVLALSWTELTRISANRIPPGMGIYGSILLGICNVLMYYYLEGRITGPGLYLPSLFPLILMVLYLKLRTPGESNLLFTLAGSLYLMLAFTSLHYLVLSGGSGYDPSWVLFTLGMLWINDTMAYVTGRLIGRHRIWPEVSPGKTWEGSLGGALFALLLAFIFGSYFQQLSTWQWLGFALIVVLTGTAGDLLESRIKRTAGLKDSGNLLPGHGGILDRFDSFLLAIPSASLYLFIIK